MRIAVPFLVLALLSLPAIRAGAMAPIALNSLSGVPTKISAARVLDTHGVQVGTVARIDTDARGKPLKATIALTEGGTAVLDASALGYDETANVLVTDRRPAKPPPAR